MERFTISLDSALAKQFDSLIRTRGYGNRSEAIRDMLRDQMERMRVEKGGSAHCVANLSYVYNHHERRLAERLNDIQHRYHHLTVASQHAHLDHDNCLETVILRGPTAEIRVFADAVAAERGVRHAQLNLISVDIGQQRHAHAPDDLGMRARPHEHVHPKG